MAASRRKWPRCPRRGQEHLEPVILLAQIWLSWLALHELTSGGGGGGELSNNMLLMQYYYEHWCG